MHSLLRRAGLSTSSAEDAFQEIAVLLWKNLRRLREVDRLASWLGTTTRRVAWRLRAEERSRSAHEGASGRPESSREDDPRAFDEEQALRESLAELGPRCRELLSLLFFQSSDLSYDEIAARLTLPRGSLGPTRRRCLESLRIGLEARGVRSDVSGPAQRVSAHAKGKARPRTPR